MPLLHIHQNHTTITDLKNRRKKQKNCTQITKKKTHGCIV